MGALAKRVFPRAWNLPQPPFASTALPPPPPPAAEAADKTAGSGPTTAVTATTAAPLEDNRKQVFHASIAQCYDKKLEASRKDFRHDDLAGETEVDIVLTTAEVLELIEERAAAAAHVASPFKGNSPFVPATVPPPLTFSMTKESTIDTAGVFFRSLTPCDLAEPLAPGFPVGQAAASSDGVSLFGGVDGEGSAGGNSGGYLEYVFRYAALTLFGVDLAGEPLVYREGRNPDFRETSLEVRVPRRGVRYGSLRQLRARRQVKRV